MAVYTHFMPKFYEFCVCVGLGMLGGLVVGVGHGILETLWFYILSGLEKKGHIKRLAPSIDVTKNSLQKESFWAVAISHTFIFIGLAAFRHGFIAHAKPEFDLLSSLTFTWVVMVLHDAWFWFVHTSMHHFKSLYMKVHQYHHLSKGDITVYSTAFADAADIFLIFPSFYAFIMTWVYFQPEWNPISFIFLGWAFNGVDMMGHCGYELPLWVYVPGSLGVLLTPWAQRPKHHYIHHLDPRFNRSLYFTWWDRAMGTFRDSHPKITNDNYW